MSVLGIKTNPDFFGRHCVGVASRVVRRGRKTADSDQGTSRHFRNLIAEVWTSSNDEHPSIQNRRTRTVTSGLLSVFKVQIFGGWWVVNTAVKLSPTLIIGPETDILQPIIISITIVIIISFISIITVITIAYISFIISIITVIFTNVIAIIISIIIFINISIDRYIIILVDLNKGTKIWIHWNIHFFF